MLGCTNSMSAVERTCAPCSAYAATVASSDDRTRPRRRAWPTAAPRRARPAPGCRAGRPPGRPHARRRVRVSAVASSGAAAVTPTRASSTGPRRRCAAAAPTPPPARHRAGRAPTQHRSVAAKPASSNAAVAVGPPSRTRRSRATRRSRSDWARASSAAVGNKQAGADGLGPLLVQLAGVEQQPGGDGAFLPDAAFRRVMDVNYHGALRATRAALPGLRAAGGHLVVSRRSPASCRCPAGRPMSVPSTR